MRSPRARASAIEVASETGALLVGSGILTTALFPIALPGVLLFVVAPAALIAVPAVLVAGLLLPPLWLARVLLRARSRSSR